TLLGHADMRIRQEAQFELAARGNAGPLRNVAIGKGLRLARLHAIWGLGQIARKEPGIANFMMELTHDKDAEVRAQACKLVGEHKVLPAFRVLVERLKDEKPRVRFFAAQSLGKLGKVDAVPPIVEMLRDNADTDAYLRHAGVMALVWIGDRETINAVARDPS